MSRTWYRSCARCCCWWSMATSLATQLYRRAREAMREVVAMCEQAAGEGRHLPVDLLADEYVGAVEKTYQDAISTIDRDDKLMDTIRPLSMMTVELYKKRCAAS
mmetsp:Transcript_22072/g.62934  ORF Transcript_22072/g.62934 Transcript_22072/m.62934 type:complete len:104 (+) Transcript_22072:513-824(+)